MKPRHLFQVLAADTAPPKTRSGAMAWIQVGSRTRIRSARKRAGGLGLMWWCRATAKPTVRGRGAGAGTRHEDKTWLEPTGGRGD